MPHRIKTFGSLFPERLLLEGCMGRFEQGMRGIVSKQLDLKRMKAPEPYPDDLRGAAPAGWHIDVLLWGERLC